MATTIFSSLVCGLLTCPRFGVVDAVRDKSEWECRITDGIPDSDMDEKASRTASGSDKGCVVFHGGGVRESCGSICGEHGIDESLLGNSMLCTLPSPCGVAG